MTCYLANLEQESLLHLQGPDALSFLQGQVTCDTRRLGLDAALPGIFCTVQGRVVCDFLLCQLSAEHLMLRMRRDIRASSAALFAKYIVFSKATLEPEREDWQVVGCWGPGGGALLQEIFGAVPSAQFGAVCGEGFAVVQRDAAGEQFECFLQRDTAAAALDSLQAGAKTVTEQAWRALEIAAGIARIEAATSGEYIPQMLNYDLTGHISFNKGCYTGQEVVARMHYRGKSKRRLYPAGIALADLPARQLPMPGDPVYGGDGQSVGNIINCVAGDDNDRLALLVTATSTSLDSGLRVFAADGPSLTVGAPPYPIPAK